MSLTLHPDWKAILCRAWSVRAIAGVAIVEVSKEALPYVADWVPHWLVFLILIGAIALRVLKQDPVEGAHDE